MDQGPIRRLEENLGQQLALALAAAARTATYYDENNVVLQQTVSRLMEVLEEYWQEEDAVTLGIHSHSVFVDRVRVPAAISTYERFSLLADLFERWGISQITFSQGLSPEELVVGLKRLARADRPTGQSLEDLLVMAGVEHIAVEEAVPEEEVFRSRRVFHKAGAGVIPLAPVFVYSGAVKLSIELARMGVNLNPGP